MVPLGIFHAASSRGRRRGEIPNNKHRPARPEIPNNKHQIPNKHQIRRTEIQNARGLAVTVSVRVCISRVRTVAPPRVGAALPKF